MFSFAELSPCLRQWSHYWCVRICLYSQLCCFFYKKASSASFPFWIHASESFANLLFNYDLGLALGLGLYWILFSVSSHEKRAMIHYCQSHKGWFNLQYYFYFLLARLTRKNFPCWTLKSVRRIYQFKIRSDRLLCLVSLSCYRQISVWIRHG